MEVSRGNLRPVFPAPLLVKPPSTGAHLSGDRAGRPGDARQVDPQRLWAEAEAIVQADADADLVDEAYEVFLAEAARLRLVDRRGAVRLQLRCGRHVEGSLLDDLRVGAHLGVSTPSGGVVLVATQAIAVLEGSSQGLRAECASDAASDVTLTSWLREAWRQGVLLRVTCGDGLVRVGVLRWVGADHAEFLGADGVHAWVVPYASAEAWALG